MTSKRTSCSRTARGFTYLALLVAIAILSLGLTSASEIWQTTSRRQQLALLDWRGQQYARAIGSYYESTPGLAKAFPPSLESLLADRRQAVTRRHLREIYPNPLEANGRWELLVDSVGHVRGVRASVPWQSELPPREWVYQGPSEMATRIVGASSLVLSQ